MKIPNVLVFCVSNSSATGDYADELKIHNSLISRPLLEVIALAPDMRLVGQQEAAPMIGVTRAMVELFGLPPPITNTLEKRSSLFMLRQMREPKRFAIGAMDGDIGEVNDFVFDDKNWTVRYLVADTQRWLPGRKVLISPIIVDPADWQNKRLPALLTREQMQNSPDISMDEVLSGQDEVKYFDYYNWPYYWAGGEIWGSVTLPRDLIAEGIDRKVALTKEINESHLRSMRDVTGYSIQATDGEIGRVDDFIVDDDGWIIRYMIVDTRTWWPEKRIIISPQWISHVDWKNSNLYVNLSRHAIKSGPEYDPEKLSLAYEAKLDGHYGEPNYWWC